MTAAILPFPRSAAADRISNIGPVLSERSREMAVLVEQLEEAAEHMVRQQWKLRQALDTARHVLAQLPHQAARETAEMIDAVLA